MKTGTELKKHIAMKKTVKHCKLVLSKAANRKRKLAVIVGHGILFAVASAAALAILFIFYYICRDAVPFFLQGHSAEFFSSSKWYPSGDPPCFGAQALFVGSILVTLGAAALAVPLGVAAAVCLSDMIPFALRQFIKPIIEILAAIPSVAYGFFALVVLAPLLQESGGHVLSTVWWIIATPFFILAVVVLGDILTTNIKRSATRYFLRSTISLVLGLLLASILILAGRFLEGMTIITGTNALNVSLILGIMALPTIVSVSEDALQAVGRELREGSLALGATRSETLMKVVIPAASSGICAAIMLGIMRALGETMVVWMASGNAAQIPNPFFNYLEPVRTMTATIAGDMGEADHVTGSARYHVLFSLGLCLLLFCFLCNSISEWIVTRQRKRLGGT